METGVGYRTVRLTAANTPALLIRVAAVSSTVAIVQETMAMSVTTTEVAPLEEALTDSRRVVEIFSAADASY